MPKKGKSKAGHLDPLKLPILLQTALSALYGHYKKTFELWADAKVQAPPCFIIVCNNTSASKLVYDYVSGFHRKNDDGTSALENGRLELFATLTNTATHWPVPNATNRQRTTRIRRGARRQLPEHGRRRD